MKKIVTLTTILVLYCHVLNAQIVGGTGSGQMATREVKPSEVSGGGQIGNVNTFNGTYGMSYPLGTVSTPTGLSHTVNLSYGGTFSGGTNPPHVSGVPYGEGWNVAIPSISVSSEAYHNYTYNELRAICHADSNYYECLSFDQEELRKEGDSYWFAPTLSIPGVASGRLVYKAKNSGSGEAIFVLRDFEEYVEAHFNGSRWKVILPNGINYEFTVTQSADRGAANQQVDYSLVEAELTEISDDPIDITPNNARNVLENVLPKTEIVSWYVSEISNPNLLGDVIKFEYEKYGKREYYKEMYQYGFKNLLAYYLNKFHGSATRLYLDPPYILRGSKDIFYYDSDTGVLECTDCDSPDITCTDGYEEYDDPNREYPSLICGTDTILCYYEGACGDNILTDQVGTADLNTVLLEALGLSDDETYFFNFLNSNIDLDNIREGVVYTDIFLKSVKAECGSILIEQIDLDYETLNDPTVLSQANKMLLLGEPGVKSEDALYNYKTVYHQGNDIDIYATAGYDPSTLMGGFTDWKRYKHAMHNDVQIALNYQAFMTSSRDPYQKGYSNCVPTYTKEGIAGGSDIIDFNHSFLESGVLRTNSLLYDSDYIAGETYEVRTLIDADSEKMCNFDINIVAAKGGTDGIIQCGTAGSVPYNMGSPTSYLNNRQTSIFSTFNKAIKWNNQAGLHSDYLYTSNYFTLPNLPNAYAGFYIQVGPANSDHAFDINPSDSGSPIRCTQNGFVVGANNYNAYVNRLGDSGLNDNVRATQAVPGNFGMGLPWYMIRSINDRISGTVDPYNSFCEPTNNYYNNWWKYENDGNLGGSFENQPTLATEGDFGLNGVEVIRYSKNPYMLNSVKHYKLNGEVSNGNQEGMKLINEHRFEYDLETVVTYDAPSDLNTGYEPTTKFNHNRNVFLLKKIIKVPVNPSGNASNDISSDMNTYPSFHFTYDVLDISIEVNSLSNNKTTSVILPIKTITNFLGGKTELTYYPLSINDVSIKYTSNNRIVHNDGGTLDMDFETNRASTNAIQIFPRVATKTVEDETPDPKTWGYDYLNPESRGSGNPGLNQEDFDRGQYGGSEKGYKTVTVYEPELNGENNYTEYHHYIEPRLFGKVNYIKKYNDNGELMQETEYDYESVLAYKNYVYTNANVSSNKEYYNQIDNSPFTANNLTGTTTDYGNISGLNRVYFYETHYATEISDTYLDSYFIKLNSQTTTNYDLETGNHYSEIMEYDYWEADANGVPIGSAWESEVSDRVNMLSFGNYQIAGGMITPFYFPPTQLTFDPSWQIFSTKTSSSENSGVETETRKYYYYDQINAVGGYPSNFPVLWFTVTHGNRQRLSQELTIQKSVYDDKTLYSDTFYEYSDEWNVVNDMLPIQTVEVDVSGIPPCDSLQTIAENNIDYGGSCIGGYAPPCNCIKSFGGDVPPGYYQIFIGVIAYHCPITQVENFNIDTDSIDENNFLTIGKYNLNDPLGLSLFLKKIHIRSLYSEALPDEAFLKYLGPSENELAGVTAYSMLPYENDYIQTKEILERNRFGQVALEKNERNLQTKYEYSKFTPIFYSYGGAYNTSHACYSRTVMFQENVGLPIRMVVGYEHEDSLVYTYSYNQDYSLSSITNPSGLTHSYTYDEYGRLKETKKNGLLISEHDYSFWQNEDIAFDARTDQNFTEASVYIEGDQPPIISRSFVDPLGRSAGSLSQAGNVTVASGQADYDKWNRITHAYKPHTNGGDFIISSFIGSAYAKNIYEDDWNGRVTNSYKYGLDGTDKDMNYEYSFLTKIDLLLEIAEIGETEEFAELIGPYSNTSSTFIKTVQRDEDDKPLITYSNTAGQTLISIQYANDETNAESLITQFFYNSYGKVSKTINPKRQESQYIYGSFGRLIKRITPDNGTTEYKYDNSNLLIAEQDAKAANENYVRHYTYDIFGKVTRQQRLYGPSSVNYSNNSIIDTKVEKEWIYHDNAELNTTEIFPQITQTMTNTPSSYQGKLTFAKSYNNEGIPVIYHFYIYNELEQLQYEFQQCNPNGINSNTKGGLLAVGYPAYNLQNSVKIQNVYHGGGPDLQAQYRYTYDEWGRMENVYLSPRGGNGPINENHMLIATYNYKDDTGQLEKTNYYKGIECEVDSIEYQYDQRDRLTDINSTLFQWQMLYDEANVNTIGSNNSNNYNGNINATIGTYTLALADNEPDNFGGSTTYGYTYDFANRLTEADARVVYAPFTLVNPSAGDVTYNFDKIGNFTQLNRRSPTGPNTQIDYNYPTGNNRLESVNIGNDTHNIGYDSNGNMLSNEQKGIVTTEYGRSNLPFSLENATNTKYLYDINDKRIYKQVRKGSTNLKEFYFRTATGDEIGVGNIYPIYTETDTLTQVDWTWYVHGIERIARFELEESRLAYSEHFERLICGVPYEQVLKMRQQKDSTGVSFEEKEHEIIDKIQEIDWLNEKNQGILSALDRINVYIDSTNTEFYEIRMPQSDQVLELEMEDGDIQYTMQTTLDSMLQSSFSMNYQMIGSFAINDTKTPIPLTKTDNTISNELCLYELILSYTRADSARTIKPTVLPRQVPDIVNLTYYVHDHLGNTRVTYRRPGCGRYYLEGVFDYYPYGKILRQFPDTPNEKYLTTHHQRDEETTLDYRYARFYDSDLGRFLSIDPRAEKYPSISSYVYVANNPLLYTDPNGDTLLINLHKKGTWAYRDANLRVKKPKNDGVFLVSGHGNPNAFGDDFHNIYNTPEDLHKAIGKFDSEQNLYGKGGFRGKSYMEQVDKGKKVTVILYGCATACHIDQHGNTTEKGDAPFAQKFSEFLAKKNRRSLVTGANGESLGNWLVQNRGNDNPLDQKGKWVTYKEGVPIYERGMDFKYKNQYATPLAKFRLGKKTKIENENRGNYSTH